MEIAYIILAYFVSMILLGIHIGVVAAVAISVARFLMKNR